MLPLIIGAAALGALKWLAHDKPQADASRTQRANEIRYSPWTHLQPSTQIQESDLLGNTMQGAMTGAMLGQGIKGMEGADALRNAQIDYLNANTPGVSSAGGLGVGSIPPAVPTAGAYQSVVDPYSVWKNPYSLR